MKIVYAVYHDCNKEERSKEVLECCLQLGEVHFVSYARPANDYKNLVCYLINKKSKMALFSFISRIKKTVGNVNPDLILLHDSDCAVTIPYIKKHCPKAKLVYDSSEFDVPMKGERIKRNNGLIPFLKSFFSRFRIKSEKKYMKFCDLVIAANEERAKLMVSYFELKKQPIVFDNMHRINDPINVEQCKSKFDKYLDNTRFQVLFAGGIDEERLTFDYIKSFSELSDEYRLIIVGSATKKALERYDSMLNSLNIENKVMYLGFITRSELRYLIQSTDASVVVFDKKTYNTLYCASGKFYESLFEYKPILASENPPLLRICQENGIGVSDDNYANGIKRLKQGYNTYLNNVKRFVDNLDYDGRITILAKTIREELKC